MLYILLLIISQINYIHSSNCDCSLIDLEEQEKLNRELYRFRIEYPNGLNKYQENQYILNEKQINIMQINTF